MTGSIDTAFIGMKVALDQMERTGQQITSLMEDTSPKRSSSDLASDMVQLSSEQRTFEANAEVARTADKAVGTLLDLIV